MKEEPSLNYFLSMGVGSLLTIVTYFVSRTFGRVDSSEKCINALREDIGVLKASEKKQWQAIDFQKDLNEALIKENQAIRERLVALEVVVKMDREKLS